jgi:hypothetical protein
VGRITYLRTLIEATQDELQGKKGESKPVQLAALSVVHERFYAIILAAAQAFVPKTQKDRAVALHKRANFARTALGAVRGHIKAGEDIVLLNASKATKRALKSPPRKATPLSVKRWKAKAESQSKALVATLMGLADADKGAAVEEMQLVLGQLTTQLVAMGVVATKDAAQAFDEHRPLRIGKTLFMPTDTQVVRQMARPS